MTAQDVVNEYITTINKLEELRLLLKRKLIQLKAIDSTGLIDGKNVTLPKLLTKVNPTDLNSVINKNLPNQPIDLTDNFVTDLNNSQYSIEAFNSLLIDKINFYRKYMMYQLENMGVPKYDINTAITLKKLILLLDKVERIRTVDYIFCDEDTLIVNQDNEIKVTILDEIGYDVISGVLEIYENGTCIYRKNVDKDVIIKPTTIGEHTYSFRYVNITLDENNNEINTVNKYITSNFFNITFDVIYTPLDGSIILKNITPTSKYYTIEEDGIEGYVVDKWDIDVNITNIDGDAINQRIPFKIYMNDTNHLLYTGVTDASGYAKIDNINIPYCNSEFVNFKEEAITSYKKPEAPEPNDSIYNTFQSDEIIDIKFGLVDENGEPISGAEVKLYIDDNTHIFSERLQLIDIQKKEINTLLTISSEQITVQNGNQLKIDAIYIDDFGEPIEDAEVVFYANPDDKDVESELSFVKNPTLETKIIIEDEEEVEKEVITYSRVNFTSNNYLDDLNGCITDISIVNGVLQYSTFQTSQHIKISNINNLRNKVGYIITELFYDGENVDYETINLKKYEYEKDIENTDVYLILETTLDASGYENITIDHPIIIYHIPISTNQQYLTWYKTDPDIPNVIPFVLYDELTGDPLTYIHDIYHIQINDDYDIVDDVVYNYPIDINSLPYGQTILYLTLSYRDLSHMQISGPRVVQANNNYNYTLKIYDENNNPIENATIKIYNIEDETANIVFDTSFVITLLSNFVLPSKTSYYLNDTPEIYYLPKGEAIQSQKVNITTNNNSLNGSYYTSNTGLIHIIQEWLTATTYILTLIAASQGLTEQRSFTYELKKPFDINVKSYNKTQGIVYELKIYDKDHFDWSNAININDYVVVKNNNNNVSYTYTSSTTTTQATYNITIPCNSNTYGTNTIKITINGYTETLTFKLYQHLFELQTTTTYLGNQTIQVKTFDDNLTTMNISGTGVTQNSITKSNNVFNINCNITQAAPNGITLSMTDNNGTTETATLTIPKSNITTDFYIEDNSFPYQISTDNYIHWNIDATPTSENISVIFNNGVNNTTKTISLGTAITNATFYNFYGTTQAPGTYTASITFNGNNNYNSFTKTLTYTIEQLNSTMSIASRYTVYNSNELLFKAKLDGTDNITVGYGSPSYSVENGENIVTGKGIIFSDGWTNAGHWQCDFDLRHQDLGYEGINFISNYNINPIHGNGLLASWEGSFFDQPKYHNGNINQVTAYHRFVDWFHVTIKKTSAIHIQIFLPDYDLFYETDIATLSTFDKVSAGTTHSRSSDNYGPSSIKNFIVTRID